jgi:hypothetical protein
VLGATSLSSFFEVARALLGAAPVRTIVELGARDCAETLDFHATFLKRAFTPSNAIRRRCPPAVPPSPVLNASS